MENLILIQEKLQHWYQQSNDSYIITRKSDNKHIKTILIQLNSI